MQFAHPHETRVREGHRHFSVAGHGLRQDLFIVFGRIRDAENVPSPQRQQGAIAGRRSAQEMQRFGEYGLARVKRGRHLAEAVLRPCMMGIPTIEKRDERTGISEDDFAHFPKSSMYLGFVERSLKPLSPRFRMRSFANS